MMSSDYVNHATKVDAFMADIFKYKRGSTKDLIQMEADAFVFNHFCGEDYKQDMFCINGVEVYRIGKLPTVVK